MLMSCWGRCAVQQTAGGAQLSQHLMQRLGQPRPQQQLTVLLLCIKVHHSRQCMALLP
jgi:hypothetical protein